VKRRRENELAPPVVRHLAQRGYRVWVDPDGSDYLDIVARRGAEIGLVELKLTAWRKVLAQGIRRRGWADWIAVVLPRRTLTDRLVAAPQAVRAERLGVWLVNDDDRVEEIRPARPLWGPGEARPFPELRARIDLLLDALETGRVVPGVRWNLPGSNGGLPGGRRSTRDWRLEEFE